MRRLVKAFDRGMSIVVSATVVILLAFMVTLSFSQVLLRNILGEGITWAEIVLQHSVLAVGMFGAVIAARQGRQIAIDILGRISKPLFRRILTWITGLFTIVISLVLAQASWIFVLSEKEFGSELVDGMAAWPFQLSMPIGFVLIAIQVLLNLALGRMSSQEAAVASANVLPEKPNQESPEPGEESP